METGGVSTIAGNSSGESGGAAHSGGQFATGGNYAAGGSPSSGGIASTGGGATGGAPTTGGNANSLGGFGGCDGTPTLGTVSAAALQAELSQVTRTFLLINVHIPLAGNIPGTDADVAYTDIASIEAFIGADKSKPVVIYCMSDHMATIAGPQLVSDGYCQVRYLSGGLNAWTAAGYSVNQ